MGSSWVKEELEGINLGDKRLNKRILEVLSAASKQPESSLNQMFHTRKEVQACYRFFSNDLVDENKIIQPHQSKTFERAGTYPVVLTLSDTTSLNYSTRKTLEDSGYISSNNAQGFFLHATIAVTPDRLHLGIIDHKFWARDKQKTTRSSKERERMLFTEKESYRWLEAYNESCELSKKCNETLVIHVTDREGDIFEIYEEYHNCKQKGFKPSDFIIRSNHNRTILGNEDKLYKAIGNTYIRAEISFDLTKREENRARRVRQSVHAMPIQIKSRYGADRPNVQVGLNAVYLKEIDPPVDEKPIIWCLLTSLPIDSLEQIKEIVKYYLCRWEIELLFKTYKSGCKVEEKSLRSAERLYPLFSILLIVAWRLNFLLHMSRIAPEISCEAFFDASEWRAGYVAATRDKASLPSTPPSMRVMIGYIAKLGGYLGRKNDPEPGIKALWTGICKLTHYADAWDLFGPGSET